FYERRPSRQPSRPVLPGGAKEGLTVDDTRGSHGGTARNGLRALEVRRRSEEHTSELQSLRHLVCRLLLEKKKNTINSWLPHIQPASGRHISRHLNVYGHFPTAELLVAYGMPHDADER